MKSFDILHVIQNATRLPALYSKLVCLVLMYAFVVLFNFSARAQDLTGSGSPGSTTVQPAELGFVDTGSGSLHLEIPIASFPQRGGPPINLNFSYSSNI